MEKKTIKEVMANALESRGLSVEKVLEATEVPKHYFQAILKGDQEKLPAAPYVRGYINKLETVLGVEANSLWNLYKEESDLKTSGAKDKLPENRFTIKSDKRKWLWIPPVVIIAGIYLILNSHRLLGLPKLDVLSPLAATVIVKNSNFLIEGEINPEDKLLINNEEVFVDKTGKFEENYKLQAGLNTFELMAKKFLGKEKRVVKQIIYENGR